VSIPNLYSTRPVDTSRVARALRIVAARAERPLWVDYCTDASAGDAGKLGPAQFCVLRDNNGTAVAVTTRRALEAFDPAIRDTDEHPKARVWNAQWDAAMAAHRVPT
jgi:hypothetical protein